MLAEAIGCVAGQVVDLFFQSIAKHGLDDLVNAIRHERRLYLRMALAGQGDPRIKEDRDAGNDYLYGGAGSNTLFGGNGDDVFAFNGDDVGNGFNLVRDYEAGDTVELFNTVDADVVFEQVGNSTLLSVDGNFVALFENTDANDIVWSTVAPAG